MTNITFKNGLPLLLQPAPGSDIGLVAADSGCCCPPPPPERCLCGNFCSYFLELVDPSEIAVKTPVFECSLNGSNASVSVNDFLWDVDGYNFNYNSNGGSAGYVRVNNFELVGAANHIGQDRSITYVLNGELRAPINAVNLSLGLQVSCGVDSNSQPYYAVQIYIVLTVISRDFIGSSTVGYGTAAKRFDGVFEIPSECVVSPEKECVPPGSAPPSATQQFSRIITPLTVTVSGDGTSSLGALTETAYPPIDSPRPGDVDVQEMADAILNAASWTFRITARENCLPPENVCCCLENTVTVNTAEECDGTTSPVADPIVDLEDISIVVDWDGLTATLDYPYFSEFVSEAVEFSCQKPNEAEAFNATERSFQANFVPNNDIFSPGQCRWFSGGIYPYFIGKYPSNNFDTLAQGSVLGPYVGECKLLAPVDEDDTSCTFTQSGGWCMDNPFSDSVTVEMIIAP